MKVAIIGAGGYIGHRLTQKFLDLEALQSLSLLDTADFTAPDDPRIVQTIGDIGDPDTRARVLGGADKIVVLAAILGGAAEANYQLARAVNVDAMLNLFEHVREELPHARLVFASTIAVFAKPLPKVVTDSTPLGPSMVYGAQKLMMEIALSNFQRRGWVDGVSLRPSGVMARDGADARLKTAFMSRMFYAVKRGEDIELPVAPESTTWLTSIDAIAGNFLHASLLDSKVLGTDRAFTLPALRLSFAELTAALFRKFPDSRAQVTYRPDPEIVALFGSYPDLKTDIADRLGFARDKDADDLVRNALDQGQPIFPRRPE
jgi:naringenin degradation protein FdeJ